LHKKGPKHIKKFSKFSGRLKQDGQIGTKQIVQPQDSDLGGGREAQNQTENTRQLEIYREIKFGIFVLVVSFLFLIFKPSKISLPILFLFHFVLFFSFCMVTRKQGLTEKEEERWREIKAGKKFELQDRKLQ
jgi:hypothetical protein